MKRENGRGAAAAQLDPQPIEHKQVDDGRESPGR